MDPISQKHVEGSKKQISVIALTFLFTLLLAVVALGLGSSITLSLESTIMIVLGLEDATEIQSVIIWELRFPRVLMAITGGAALAIAGALMQGSLGNPLVSPLTLGVASGAALGAALGIIIGFSIGETMDSLVQFIFDMMGASPPLSGAETVIVANAFFFSLVVVFIIIQLGNYRSVSAESYILVGIAITFIAGAIVSTMTYFATDAQLSQLTHWSFGSLARVSQTQAIAISLIVIIMMPSAMKWAWDLNTLSMGGDGFAISTGVDPASTRKRILILSAFMTSIIISFTGLIGFVGLAAPHMSRLVVGNDYRTLIPCSAVFGSLLVLAADTIGRIVIAPVIIPVGIMLAIIGGPFFMYLLLQNRGFST